MSDNPLPLSRPSLGEEEIGEVLDVIRSGWITSGPRVKRFEEEFSRYVGARHAVAVNSCTAALHVALLAHGMGRGDEVITSSMTWSATVNMIEVAGAKPVFADVDRKTLQITPESVAAAVTERTRAILPVHFAGQACDLRRTGCHRDTSRPDDDTRCSACRGHRVPRQADWQRRGDGLFQLSSD